MGVTSISQVGAYVISKNLISARHCNRNSRTNRCKQASPEPCYRELVAVFQKWNYGIGGGVDGW